jgi:hypothetical protein
MKRLKQIREESESKVPPVVKKKGFIAKGFVPPIETKPAGKK